MNGGASFEFFVALRYLRAKRKQAVISIITAISVAGVAAGVMALIVALAINNGFRNTLQRTLVGATAHVSIVEKEYGEGIANYRDIARQVKSIPHVRSAAPTLYGSVFLAGPVRSSGAVLKGIDPASESHRADLEGVLKKGAFQAIQSTPDDVPGIIIGSRLAESTGMMLHSRITVISPQGELTPFGPRPSFFPFRVAGIFETQVYEIDSNFAFTTIQAMQRILSVKDVANSVEMKVDPIEKADEVARAAEKILPAALAATSWAEQNKGLFGALKMERMVAVITIGLIQLVAALNILTSLTMMVMEKHRDIALLLSMGATRRQIRRIFLFQGLLIGAVGTLIGLIAGYALSFGAQGRIALDQQVYSLSHVPLEPRWMDGIWVAGGAMLVSLLATLYPARNATRILPAEALRYE